MVEKMQEVVEKPYVNIDEITKELSKVVRDIIVKQVYYGIILSTVNRTISDKKLLTAGVYRSNINMHMDINPYFWTSLPSTGQKMFVLCHELMHICYAHPVIMLKYSDKELFNVAADIEINQYVKEVPGTEWIPGGLALEDFFVDHQNHVKKGTKYYYDLLRQKIDEYCQSPYFCPQGGQGEDGDMDGAGGEFGDSQGNDDQIPPELRGGKKAKDLIDKMRKKVWVICSHESWKEFNSIDESEGRLLEGQIKRQMGEALKDVPSSLWGTLPGVFREALEEINKNNNTYDWRKIFRRIALGLATTTFLRQTRKKESLRFPSMPGIKLKQHCRVLCALDVSGSIGQADLVEFFSEVDNMRKKGVEVWIAEFDTVVDKKLGHYQFRHLKQIESKSQFTGGGGTCFDAAIHFLNEKANKFNLLIYLTDGIAPVPQVKARKPIIWTLSSAGKTVEQMEKYPGFKIKIVPQEDLENAA